MGYYVAVINNEVILVMTTIYARIYTRCHLISTTLYDVIIPTLRDEKTEAQKTEVTYLKSGNCQS